MHKQDKFIALYEQKMTEISARITRFIKEAGTDSAEGGRLGWILHEVNGAFSNAYTLIELQRIQLAELELKASMATPMGDRIVLEKLIRDHRLAQLHADGADARDVSAADEALVEAIIHAGWRSPNTLIETGETAV